MSRYVDNRAHNERLRVQPHNCNIIRTKLRSIRMVMETSNLTRGRARARSPRMGGQSAREVVRRCVNECLVSEH